MGKRVQNLKEETNLTKQELHVIQTKQKSQVIEKDTRMLQVK